jgi:inner membrane protein
MVVGAALARLAPASLSPGRLALVLAGAAAMPDLDVVAFVLGIPYGDPLGHRGFTHSLLFAALVAPALASLSGVRPHPAIRPYLIVCWLGFLAVASHGVLDAFTDAGLGVGFLLPFSDERFFFPWRPIMTSPIGPAFFSVHGLAILKNEAVWIIAPTLIGSLVVHRLLRAR